MRRRKGLYRRHIRARARYLIRVWQQFILHNVLHADDPPERLARGAAVGVFVTFTPTVGFQMALVLFLAWLLRANKIVGLPIVWATNPVTFVPIYYPCYVIGAMILGHDVVGLSWWRQLGQPPEGMWDMFMFYRERLETIALPLWTGCFLVASLLGLLTYYVVFNIVRGYRLRRWGKLIPPAAIRPHKIKSDAA